jgi:hypothetical protein|eukprot:COSAG01_NODE_1716_length_9403_cov_4.038697_2_plen_247_part_00
MADTFFEEALQEKYPSDVSEIEQDMGPEAWEDSKANITTQEGFDSWIESLNMRDPDSPTEVGLRGKACFDRNIPNKTAEELKKVDAPQASQAVAEINPTPAGLEVADGVASKVSRPDGVQKTNEEITEAENNPEQGPKWHDELKKKSPQIVIAGLTIAGLTAWAIVTGFNPADDIEALLDGIAKAFSDPLSDTTKKLIGSTVGLAETLTKPIGSTIKTVGIIFGVVAGLVILVVGIYYGIRKAKQA